MQALLSQDVVKHCYISDFQKVATSSSPMDLGNRQNRQLTLLADCGWLGDLEHHQHALFSTYGCAL